MGPRQRLDAAIDELLAALRAYSGEPDDPAELLAAFQAGDEAAGYRLLCLHPNLVAMAALRHQNLNYWGEDEYLDRVQDYVLHALRFCNRIDRGLVGWVLRCVRGKLINDAKKELVARKRRVSELPESDIPSRPERPQYDRMVESLLAALPNEDSELVRRRFGLGCEPQTYAQMAAGYPVRKGAVRNRTENALAWLRAYGETLADV